MTSLNELMGGGVVKSVQRGVFSAPINTASANITVGAVNTEKTMLNVLSMNDQYLHGMNVSLSSATTISVANMDSDASVKRVSWELIEFY